MHGFPMMTQATLQTKPFSMGPKPTKQLAVVADEIRVFKEAFELCARFQHEMIAAAAVSYTHLTLPTILLV
eukprot:3557309-Amphidinium_carterae.1